jgi:hypothetical protein
LKWAADSDIAGEMVMGWTVVIGRVEAERLKYPLNMVTVACGNSTLAALSRRTRELV